MDAQDRGQAPLGLTSRTGWSGRMRCRDFQPRSTISSLITPAARSNSVSSPRLPPPLLLRPQRRGDPGVLRHDRLHADPDLHRREAEPGDGADGPVLPHRPVGFAAAQSRLFRTLRREGLPVPSSGVDGQRRHGCRSAAVSERAEARRAGVNVRREGMGNPDPRRTPIHLPSNRRAEQDCPPGLRSLRVRCASPFMAPRASTARLRTPAAPPGIQVGRCREKPAPGRNISTPRSGSATPGVRDGLGRANGTTRASARDGTFAQEAWRRQAARAHRPWRIVPMKWIVRIRATGTGRAGSARRGLRFVGSS